MGSAFGPVGRAYRSTPNEGQNNAKSRAIKHCVIQKGGATKHAGNVKCNSADWW